MRVFLTLFLVALALPAAAALTPDDKAEVEAIVQAYIRDNPGKVIAALQEGQAKADEAGRKTADGKIAALMDYFEGPDVPAAGNLDDPDITVIEFFDYNCGYCHKALSSVRAVLRDDPNVRVIFAEMPILSQSSELAARWALAAHKQGRYLDFHIALMEHKGPKTPTTLARLAGTVEGLDVERMKADAASPEVAAQVEHAVAISKEVGIRGTPGFVVGRELRAGYIDEDDLKKAIAQARRKARGE